jgi:hypothetical protein
MSYPCAKVLLITKHKTSSYSAFKTKEKKMTAIKAPTRLPLLHVGSGYRYGNLTWFPVWTDQDVKPRRYTTKVSPSEVTLSEKQDAQVPVLEISNTGRSPVLLFGGALLEGGWQHRALTRTMLVPAQSRTDLPVVCVEAGRWGGARTQSIGTMIAPARVRSAIRGLNRSDAGLVSQSHPSQQRVWSEVNSYAAYVDSSDETSSLVNMRTSVDQNYRSNTPAPKAISGQVGVIVALMGQPIAFELFDHPTTLKERLESILLSFLPESLRHQYVETPGRRARRFALRIQANKVEPTETEGMLRNRPDVDVATEAVSFDSLLLHVSSLNVRHELVLAA